MKVRALFSLAVAAGLTGPAIANPPAPLPACAVNPNQTLADTIASRLRTSGLATGADVSILVQEGTVTLSGTAQDATQKTKIVADVKAITGVIIVRDNLRAITPGVIQVQEPPLAPISPTPLGPITPLPPGGTVAFNPIVEPAPLGIPGHITPDLQAPNLPPYAWPTYAPHNNVSRVAYPQAYPYNAFPFIGPYYPFPKVPLGWRKVTLEWEDGHWYLGRNSAPHDYWRVRFW
ncbi:MAG: BON domain-containing protein [Planctomycetia bacterium]|nr:BON domain-containing protein [Planctomycetia bacterium]